MYLAIVATVQQIGRFVPPAEQPLLIIQAFLLPVQLNISDKMPFLKPPRNLVSTRFGKLWEKSTRGT